MLSRKGIQPISMLTAYDYHTACTIDEAGVDFISVGALTHSVKGLDMSFKAADSSKLKI